MMEVLSMLGIIGIVYFVGAFLMFAHVINEIFCDAVDHPIFVLLGGLTACAAALFWPFVLIAIISEKVRDFFGKDK